MHDMYPMQYERGSYSLFMHDMYPMQYEPVSHPSLFILIGTTRYYSSFLGTISCSNQSMVSKETIVYQTF